MAEPTSQWADDLAPIAAADWNFDRAAHLLERAGFGGTPGDIARLAAMTPQDAVAALVDYHTIANDPLNDPLTPFERSDIWDPSLRDFPVSRVAATERAEKTGEAMGVRIKPAGERRLQPVVDRFFYWLRATVLETRRLAHWWADRMVATNRPLEEKMTLFWHGHFATGEEKIRDYRKMEQQLALFHRRATGSFRELLIDVARDPAMLAYLDAAQNVKGAPNENFAREVMELFTMGVGHYTEHDIREAARAFTGWNYVDLQFVVHADQHDAADKTILGRTGNFNGVDVIDLILAQPATANFIAGKIYRYFVRQELSPALQEQLGTVLRDNKYELAPLLQTIFLSKDFHSPPAYGTHIKSPVHLVVSTYRKLGLTEVPGVPDFNEVTAALGQQLFRPPTVAGWAQGRSWITPGLLIERGNFVYDMLFPDISFVPHDRYPRDDTIRQVSDNIARGMDITSATVPDSGGVRAMSNVMADRDEDFNTRYASFKGWQMAIERVRPIPRHTAQVNLQAMVLSAGLETSEQV